MGLVGQWGQLQDCPHWVGEMDLCLNSLNIYVKIKL